MFLILPTHRKYIKLLRERANSGNPIVIKKKDMEDFRELVRTTHQRGARHRGLYRITLKAMKCSPEEIELEDIECILDNRAVNFVEKTLAKVEWKSLGATLVGAYLIPFLQAVIKRMERRSAKKEMK